MIIFTIKKAKIAKNILNKAIFLTGLFATNITLLYYNFYEQKSQN